MGRAAGRRRPTEWFAPAPVRDPGAPLPAGPEEAYVMDATRDTQKAQLVKPDTPGGAEVQARAQLALDITPKRFRLFALAAVRLPLRIIDTLRRVFEELVRLLF
jgi:hypothetical protein